MKSGVSMVDLEEARERGRELKDERATEKLKDENLKKEYFYDVPDVKQFFRIFLYSSGQEKEKISDDKYIARTSGICAWALETCVVDSQHKGYYTQTKDKYPDNIFKGTTLIEFAKEHPNLKIALVSTEPMIGFSEFFAFIDGKIIRNDCEDFHVDYEGLGVDKYPEWFKVDESGHLEVNERYVFDVLNEK